MAAPLTPKRWRRGPGSGSTLSVGDNRDQTLRAMNIALAHGADADDGARIHGPSQRFSAAFVVIRTRYRASLASRGACAGEVSGWFWTRLNA